MFFYSHLSIKRNKMIKISIWPKNGRIQQTLKAERSIQYNIKGKTFEASLISFEIIQDKL